MKLDRFIKRVTRRMERVIRDTDRVIKTIVYIIRHPQKVHRLVYSSMIQYPELYKRLILEKEEESLDMLGKIEKTDKASAIIEDTYFVQTHDYLKYYEVFMAHLKGKRVRILEFGCLGGNSLRMWRKYFKNSELYGVDIDEKCKQLERDNIKIIIGNVVSTETVKILQDKGGFDIIIDDASHAWGEQRWALEHYWPFVSKGGYYIVEDLECGAYGAYVERGYIPEIVDGMPFWDYALNLANVLRWPVKDVEKQSSEMEGYSQVVRNIMGTIDMMVMIPGAIIMRKKSQ